MTRYLETEGQHRRRTTDHLLVRASEPPRSESLVNDWLHNMFEPTTLNCKCLIAQFYEHCKENLAAFPPRAQTSR